MVDNYHHKRDFEIENTREVLAMLYNVNRAKGPVREGSDFMKTSNELVKHEVEIPDKNLAERVKKRYGG